MEWSFAGADFDGTYLPIKFPNDLLIIPKTAAFADSGKCYLRPLPLSWPENISGHHGSI